VIEQRRLKWGDSGSFYRVLGEGDEGKGRREGMAYTTGYFGRRREEGKCAIYKQVRQEKSWLNKYHLLAEAGAGFAFIT